MADLTTAILTFFYDIYEQAAQLSHRDRAMFRVIEYFAKSFKITQGHSK